MVELWFSWQKCLHFYFVLKWTCSHMSMAAMHECFLSMHLSCSLYLSPGKDSFFYPPQKLTGFLCVLIKKYVSIYVYTHTLLKLSSSDAYRHFYLGPQMLPYYPCNFDYRPNIPNLKIWTLKCFKIQNFVSDILKLTKFYIVELNLKFQKNVLRQ
jgi:hypothetical protein